MSALCSLCRRVDDLKNSSLLRLHYSRQSRFLLLKYLVIKLQTSYFILLLIALLNFLEIIHTLMNEYGKK